MYIFINAGDNHVCTIYNIHGRLLIQVNLHHDIIHRLDQLQLFFTFFLLDLISIINLFDEGVRGSVIFFQKMLYVGTYLIINYALDVTDWDSNYSEKTQMLLK